MTGSRPRKVVRSGDQFNAAVATKRGSAWYGVDLNAAIIARRTVCPRRCERNAATSCSDHRSQTWLW